MTGALEPFFLEDPRKLDDPFADLAWLREHRPVYHREPLAQWFVFGYDDVRALFADPRLSADRVKGFVDAVPAPVRDDVRSLVPWFRSWLMMSDGAEHSRLRRLMHHGFNASIIQPLTGPIERVANDLLERRLAEGSLDVSGDFALPLPAYVLSELHGSRSGRSRSLRRVVAGLRRLLQRDPDQRGGDRQDDADGHGDGGVLPGAARPDRGKARDDFLGAMVASSDGQDGIGEEEIVGNAMMLLLAGHLPVRNLAAANRDPSVLFERLQDVRIDEGAAVCWYRNAANRGPDELHVTFQATVG